MTDVFAPAGNFPADFSSGDDERGALIWKSAQTQRRDANSIRKSLTISDKSGAMNKEIH